MIIFTNKHLNGRPTFFIYFFSQAQPKNQRKLGAAQWPIVNKRLTGRKKKKVEREKRSEKNDTIHFKK